MRKLIFIMLLFPSSIFAQTAKEYIKQGKQMLDSAKYSEASIYFDKALILKPNYADAYYFRGIASKNIGDYSDASADFTQVIRLKPNETRGYYQRALIREIVRDFNGAEADYTAIINLDPNDRRAYRQRAAVDSTKNLTIADYAHAKNLDPKDIYLQRARIDWNDKNYKSCIDDYTFMLSLDPENIHAYANRASAKWALKDNEGAIADYTVAASLDKKYNWTYYNNIGIIKQGENDFKGAMESYTRSIDIYPSGGTYMNRGNMRFRMGDYQQAIKDFTKAISFDHRDYNSNVNKYLNRFGAVPYNDRGKAEVLTGDFKAAIADFDKAISIDPDLALAYNGRGEAKTHLGDTTGACADWQTARKFGCEPAEENIKKFCGK